MSKSSKKPKAAKKRNLPKPKKSKSVIKAAVIPDHPKTPATPHRFAHPFFTSKPIAQRTPVPGVGTRMVDYIEVVAYTMSQDYNTDKPAASPASSFISGDTYGQCISEPTQ